MVQNSYARNVQCLVIGYCHAEQIADCSTLSVRRMQNVEVNLYLYTLDFIFILFCINSLTYLPLAKRRGYNFGHVCLSVSLFGFRRKFTFAHPIYPEGHFVCEGYRIKINVTGAKIPILAK